MERYYKQCARADWECARVCLALPLGELSALGLTERASPAYFVRIYLLNVTHPNIRHGQRAGADPTMTILLSETCYPSVRLRGSIHRQTGCALAPNNGDQEEPTPPGSGGHPLFEIRRSLISRSKCFAFALRTRDTPLWRGAGGITYGPRAAFGTFRRVEKYTLHVHEVTTVQNRCLLIQEYHFARISSSYEGNQRA